MGLIPSLPDFSGGRHLQRRGDCGQLRSALALTEDFGLASTTPFALGVAYLDGDADGFYTPSEGVGGIRVSSPQSSYYTTTGSAGGYSLPLDLVSVDNAVRLVFEDASGTQVIRNLTMASVASTSVNALLGPALANIKSDLAMSNGSITSSTTSVGILSTKKANRSIPKNGKFVLERLGGGTSQPLDVRYTLSGTAINGEDYKSLSGLATFAVGATHAPVKIKLLRRSDSAADPLNVTLTLEAGDVYQLSQVERTSASLPIQ